VVFVVVGCSCVGLVSVGWGLIEFFWDICGVVGYGVGVRALVVCFIGEVVWWGVKGVGGDDVFFVCW